MAERDIYIAIIIVLGVAVITLMMCLASEHEWRLKENEQLHSYLNESWDNEIVYHRGYTTACILGKPKDGVNWTKVCENAHYGF